jgi:LacI family transcriptional regulator
LKAGIKKEKVGIQDIAEALNISASTVSRALNDNPRISAETKTRVKQTAARLGYYQKFPETAEVQQADVIAIVVPSLDNNFYRAVTEGVNGYFKENGFHTFVVDTNNDKEYKDNFYANFRKYGISGIIDIISDKNSAAADYSIIEKEALPFVTVCELDENSVFSVVLPDMYQGVQKIVDYLGLLKIDNIALFLEDKNRPEDFYLFDSLKAAIDTPGGKKMNLSVHYSVLTDIRFTQEVEAVLRSKNPPQVMLVKNTCSALEVSLLATRLGVDIPSDLLLIAIDTDYKPDGMASNLSLLKLPAYEMGLEAGKILLHQIKNFDTEKKLSVLPSEFILKNSAIRINS